MNMQQVENAIGRAQQMMSEDYQRQIINAERMRGGKKKIGGGTNDLALLEQQAFGYSHSSNGNTMQQKQEVREQTSNAIRQSFAQMPALSGDNFPSDLNYQPGQSLIREQRQPMYQQPVYQQPVMYQQPIPVGGIDYSYLKNIVNECIRENLDIIKQSLNENTIRGMRMGTGNKIQFLDNKGNLYEGVLTLKKRAES